ncbi:MAG: hypothetical protein WC248_05865 [Candidatus Methanomethylophilaceae archaeon]
MNKPQSNYFLVNRDLLNSDRWLSEPFTRGQAWVDLFGLAQHTKGFFRVRGIKIEVERGQLAYSQQTLTKRWHWSRGKVKRYLSELENQNDIILKTIQQNGQQIKFLTTLITIVKYDKWQGDDTAKRTADGQQTDSRRTADGTYTKNDKNDNNEKNEKKRERDALRAYSPAQVANEFLNNSEKQEEFISKLIQKGGSEQVARQEIKKFVAYWTELNGSGSKQRWQMQKTFEVQKRLATWFGKINSFSKPAGREKKTGYTKAY